MRILAFRHVRELDHPIDPGLNARLAALSDLVFGRWCDLL